MLFRGLNRFDKSGKTSKVFVRCQYAALAEAEAIKAAKTCMNLHEVYVDGVTHVRPFFVVTADLVLDPESLSDYHKADEIMNDGLEKVTDTLNFHYGTRYGLFKTTDLESFDLTSTVKGSAVRVEMRYTLKRADMVVPSMLHMKALFAATDLRNEHLKHGARFATEVYSENPLLMPNQTTNLVKPFGAGGAFVPMDGADNKTHCRPMNCRLAREDAPPLFTFVHASPRQTVLDVRWLNPEVFDTVMQQLPPVTSALAAVQPSARKFKLPEDKADWPDPYEPSSLLLRVIGNDGQLSLDDPITRPALLYMLRSMRNVQLDEDMLLCWLDMSPVPAQQDFEYKERVLRIFSTMTGLCQHPQLRTAFFLSLFRRLQPDLGNEEWRAVTDHFINLRIAQNTRLTLNREERQELINVQTLEYDTQHFPDITQFLDDRTVKTLYMKAGMGLGKTHSVRGALTRLAQIVKAAQDRHLRVLAVVPRRAFSQYMQQLFESILGTENVRVYSDNRPEAPAWATSSIVVQLESSYKVTERCEEPFDILLIDESTCCLSEFMSPTMKGRTGDVITTVRQQIASSTKVIIACADMTDTTIAIWQHMHKEATGRLPRGVLAHLRTKQPHRTARIVAYDTGMGRMFDPGSAAAEESIPTEHAEEGLPTTASEGTTLDLLDETVSDDTSSLPGEAPKKVREASWKVLLRMLIAYINDNPGHRVYFACSSCALAEKALAEVLAQTDIREAQTELICGKTVNRWLKSSASASDRVKDKRFLVATSAFSVGVDISNDSQGKPVIYDKMFVYGSSMACFTRELMQLMRRVRSVADPEVVIAFDGRCPPSGSEPECYELQSVALTVREGFRGTHVSYAGGRDHPGEDVVLIGARHRMEQTLNRNHYHPMLVESLMQSNMDIVDERDQHQPLMTVKQAVKRHTDAPMELPRAEVRYADLDEYADISKRALMDMRQSEHPEEVEMAKWVQRRKAFDKLLGGCPASDRAAYWDSLVAPRKEFVDQMERWARNMTLELYCTHMGIDQVIQMYVPQDEVLQHDTASQLRAIRDLAGKFGVNSFTEDRLELPQGKLESVAQEILSKRAAYASIFGFGKTSRATGDNLKKQAMGLVNTVLRKWGIFEIKSANADGDRQCKKINGKNVYTGADRVRVNDKLELPEGLVARLMGQVRARVSRELERVARREAEMARQRAEIERAYGPVASRRVEREEEAMRRSARNLRQDDYADEMAYMDQPLFAWSSDDEDQLI